MRTALVNGPASDRGRGLVRRNRPLLLSGGAAIEALVDPADSRLPGPQSPWISRGSSLLPGFIDVPRSNGGGGVLFNDDPSPESIRRHRRPRIGGFGTTGFLPTADQRTISTPFGRANRCRCNRPSMPAWPGVLGIPHRGAVFLHWGAPRGATIPNTCGPLDTSFVFAAQPPARRAVPVLDLGAGDDHAGNHRQARCQRRIGCPRAQRSQLRRDHRRRSRRDCAASRIIFQRDGAHLSRANPGSSGRRNCNDEKKPGAEIIVDGPPRRSHHAEAGSGAVKRSRPIHVGYRCDGPVVGIPRETHLHPAGAHHFGSSTGFAATRTEPSAGHRAPRHGRRPGAQRSLAAGPRHIVEAAARMASEYPAEISGAWARKLGRHRGPANRANLALVNERFSKCRGPWIEGLVSEIMFSPAALSQQETPHTAGEELRPSP